MEKRHLILSMAFIATAIASIYPHQDKSIKIVDPIKHQNKQVKDKPVATIFEPRVNSNARAWAIEKDAKDLFYVKPIIVESPTKPKSVIIEPPPQPVAPPLPFIYLGKMNEEGKVTVFVSMAGRNFALKGGEIIDGVYAVQSIDAQSIVFNYLPLKSNQILATRGPN
jgi:hypothetical protein